MWWFMRFLVARIEEPWVKLAYTMKYWCPKYGPRTAASASLRNFSTCRFSSPITGMRIGHSSLSFDKLLTWFWKSTIKIHYSKKSKHSHEAASRLWNNNLDFADITWQKFSSEKWKTKSNLNNELLLK